MAAGAVQRGGGSGTGNLPVLEVAWRLDDGKISLTAKERREHKEIRVSSVFNPWLIKHRESV
jgi:hypothetical protein